VFWGVEDDGAPHPTIYVNIGDNNEFNPHQVELQSKLSYNPNMHKCLGGLNGWARFVKLHSNCDTIVLTALGSKRPIAIRKTC
jgi:hypothetical protein